MAIGQLSHLGIGKETTWGTPVTVTDYLKFTSETLALAIEELVSTSLSAKRDEPDSYEGLGSVSGDIVCEVHPNTIGLILNSWFGSVTTTQPEPTAAPSVYQHVFTPTNTPFSTDCILPPYTIEIHRDLDKAFQYSGCVANVLSFTFGVGAKILSLTSTWISKDVSLITKTTPSYDATEPFLWNTGVISIGGTTYKLVETLTFTLENGLVGIPLLDGTKRIAKIVGDAFRFGTISPTFHVEDTSKFSNFVNWTTEAWNLKFEGAEIEGGYKWTIEFDFPKVLYTAYPVNVGGPGRLTVGASGKLKYDATAGYLAKVTLINTKSSY